MTVSDLTDIDTARKIYDALGDESDLRVRAEQFTRAVALLNDFDSIDKIAIEEWEYLTGRYPNKSTLGSVVSRAGYFKRLKDLLVSESHEI